MALFQGITQNVTSGEDTWTGTLSLICVSTWPAVWTPLNKILHVIQKCGKHYTTREYEIQQKCLVFLETAIFWGDMIFRGEVIFGEKPFLGRSPFWGEAIFWRHIPVKNVVRHFLKHVGLGINKRLFQERSHILVLYVKDISL